MKLSQSRADAVRAYMVAKGIPASRLVSRGYGFHRPLVDNTTASNRELNRRVQFLFAPRRAVRKRSPSASDREIPGQGRGYLLYAPARRRNIRARLSHLRGVSPRSALDYRPLRGPFPHGSCIRGSQGREGGAGPPKEGGRRRTSSASGYPGVSKKLQAGIAKCDGDKCGAPIKGALLRDLGAMQILAGNDGDGRASFGQALALDASLELDPSYKNPQLEGIWNDAKKKAAAGGGAAPPSGGGGTPPAGGGGPRVSSPPGDFAHTAAARRAGPHSSARPRPSTPGARADCPRSSRSTEVRFGGDWKPIGASEARLRASAA